MSMKHHMNAMRQQAAMVGGRVAQTKLGIVTSYNPNTYSVKVTLQPDGRETGWIPLGSTWVGNGWGMFSPPGQGDMVEVEFAEGDKEGGVACLRFFNDQDRPLPCPSGELWLVHKSGASFKLTNNGKATFSDGHGATVALNGDGTITSAASMWQHTGQVAITGNVSINGNAMITGTELVGGAITGTGGMAISGGSGGAAASITGDLTISGGNVTADGVGLKTHHHGGVQGGTGNTGAALP